MEKTNSAIARISLICLLLILSVFVSRAQNADINLLKNINVDRNRALDKSMELLTNSVYPIAAVTPVTELFIGYKQHNKKLITKGWTSVAGLGANFIVTFGLKYAVDRPRPYITYPIIQNNKYNKDASFPSGHTSFSFNTATALYLVFPKWYVAAPAYLWATGVGYSRMHLGMHYPTDVLAGAIVGAGTAILAEKGNQWLQHHRKKNKSIEH